jgi:archaellum component FlaF (FlaF/FlaG flagellin family)
MIGLATGLMLAQPSIDKALTDLRDARDSATGEMVDIQNTGIAIAQASFNNTTSVLNVTVSNTGSTVLPLDSLDILLNGTYIKGIFEEYGFIYPGQEHLTSLSNVTDPRSVKLIGPWGLSVTTTEISKG